MPKALQYVLVRFAVAADGPKEARTTLRRALKTMALGSGVVEAEIDYHPDTQPDE